MKRAFTILVAALLASSLWAGGAVADDTRRTDLEIHQPHYIDSDVSETTDNGTTVYEAKGEVLRIYLQAFEPEDVVDQGVAPDSATLSSIPGGYELQTDEQGTHELYWIVEETVTEGNETTTERVRYEAIVRVESDHEEPVVMSSSEVAELREDAETWREVSDRAESQIENSWIFSAASILPFDYGPDAEGYIQNGLDKMEAIHNPGAAFGTGLTLLFFGILSLGGGALFAAALGLHAKIVGYLKGRLNRFELTENAEGEAAKRLEASEIKYNKIALQNDSFDDVYLPHIADGMRSLGETPFEASRNLDANGLMPSVCVAFKTQAMGHDGYVGVVDDGVATDGGESDTDATPDDTEALVEQLQERDEMLEIVPEDDVGDHATTVDLTDADREWMPVLPVNGETMRDYDPVEADIDRSKITVEAVEWDLESIVEQVRLDMRHFESERVAGKYLKQFIQDVIEHPITDPEGRTRDCRMFLETLLRDAQLLADRYEIPKSYQVEILQAAIADADPLEDGVRTVDDIERGKYA